MDEHQGTARPKAGRDAGRGAPGRQARRASDAAANERATSSDGAAAGGEGQGQAQGERLQKYLAHAGVASRRHAEELIVAGEVTVNGAVVRELGTRVDPERDEVRVRGKVVRPAAEHVYLLLNKPLDALSTAHDPQGRRTVLDLLPPEYVARRVYPVGRLDWDTEGLLLLTNDGELALRLTHPRYALTKQYAALVEGVPGPETLRALQRGVRLEGEARPTAPAKAWIERRGEANAWLGIELHEGRNRQARRMLEAVGYRVLRLRRVRVGPLVLGPLKAGEYRPLTAAELAKLRAAVGMGEGAGPEHR